MSPLVTLQRKRLAWDTADTPATTVTSVPGSAAAPVTTSPRCPVGRADREAHAGPWPPADGRQSTWLSILARDAGLPPRGT